MPEWCDVHHVVHWAHGGPTSCDNGALLCERHHTACHEGGFSVSRDAGTSTWHTWRPDGTEVLTRTGPYRRRRLVHRATRRPQVGDGFLGTGSGVVPDA
ncbi:HNH endonuclease signature motif containing protein [Geodermatophilus sp. URMC 63]